MDLEMFTALVTGLIGVLAGAAGAAKVVSRKTKNTVDDKVARKLDEALGLVRKVPLADIVALVKKLK